MIVYYSPETGNILGLSYIQDKNRTDAWFETTDPLAEKLFKGEEKAVKYKVEFAGIDSLVPSIVSRVKNTGNIVISPRDRIVLVPYENTSSKDLDVKLIQNIKNKTVDVVLLETSRNHWLNESASNKRSFYIVACNGPDPYSVAWSKEISLTDFDSLTYQIKYQGSDRIRFFTTKLFKTLAHVREK